MQRISEAREQLEAAGNPALSLQVKKYGQHLSSVHESHRRRLTKSLCPAAMGPVTSSAQQPLPSVLTRTSTPITLTTFPQGVTHENISIRGEKDNTDDDSEDEVREEEETQAYDTLLAINQMTLNAE